MTEFSTWWCPECGYVTNSTAPVNGGAHTEPKKGDVSVCLSCGAPSVFEYGALISGLYMRRPTDAERALILADSGAVGAMAAVAATRAAAHARGEKWAGE